MRFFHKLLKVYRIVSERRHRFRTGCVISFFNLVFAMNEAHPLTAPAHRGFQHHGITDAVTDFFGFFYTLQRLLCARHNRHSRRNHVLARRNLVAHRVHCFRIGTNKNNAFFTASTCKLRIFRQEAISRMDSIRTMTFGCHDNLINVQITVTRSCRAYQASFVCIKYVACRSVGL